MSNYTNPLDSAIAYDSTGVLTLSSQNFTRSTDRSFLSTFIDSDTFTDSFNDADLSDSDYGLFTRLDSANGGDLIFYSSNHDKWHKASIANTNLSSISSIADLSGSRNIFRRVEFKQFKWAFPYQDSDNAAVEWRVSGHSEHTWPTLSVQKQNARIIYDLWEHILSEGHPSYPDSGHVMSFTRYEPVTVGEDSTTYYNPLFTYNAFFPRSAGDSSRGIFTRMKNTAIEFAFDSYDVDISDFNLTDSSTEIGTSRYLEAMKREFPEVISPSVSDLRFALDVHRNYPRDSQGLSVFSDPADSDRYDEVMEKSMFNLLMQPTYPLDSEAVTLGLTDSGYHRYPAKDYPIYFILSDS